MGNPSALIQEIVVLVPGWDAFSQDDEKHAHAG
jgi:hypothetical protein